MNAVPLRSYASDCLRQAAIGMGLFLVSLLVLAGLTVFYWIAPLPGSLRADRSVPVSLAFLTYIILLAAAGSYFLLASLRRRTRNLDAVFTPLGLTGQTYLSSGRQYHGVYAGRVVDVFLYRGPILDIYVSASTRTHLGISTRQQMGALLGQAAGAPTLPIPHPELAHLLAVARDDPWALALLADPRARPLVLALTAGAGGLELRQVLVQPGALLLRLYHTRLSAITPAAVTTWVDDLVRLASVAESLPPPSIPEDATSAEQAARRSTPTRLPTGWTLVGFMALVGIGTFGLLVSILLNAR